MKLRTWCLNILATVACVASIGCKSAQNPDDSTLQATPGQVTPIQPSAGIGSFLSCNLKSTGSKSEFKWLGGSKVELFGKEFILENVNLFQKNTGFTDFGVVTWVLEFKGKFPNKSPSLISFNLPLEQDGLDPVVIFLNPEFQMQQGFSSPQNSCVGVQAINFAVIDQMIAANNGRTPQSKALTSYKFTNGKLWDCFVQNQAHPLNLISWTGANKLSFDKDIAGGAELTVNRTGIKSASVINAALSQEGSTAILKFVAVTSSHRYYGELAVPDSSDSMPSSILTVWKGQLSQDPSLKRSQGAEMRKNECKNPSSSFNRRIARDFVSQFAK